MSARWGLEHELWRILRENEATEGPFLLACSGGADSVAMVRAFAAVRPARDLIVAHAHHGENGGRFRDRAAAFVEEFARELGLRCLVAHHEGAVLRSEADLRKFRRSALEALRRDNEVRWIVTAHHRQDVLETRLIRLLRGTGPEGLPALRVRGQAWLRPFLSFEPRALRSYLENLGQVFLEDPSNFETGPLRNWLRQEWLPQLERQRPGSARALARSLEDVVEALHPDEILSSPRLARVDWEGASPARKLRLVATCLRSAGQLEMTRGQLEEIRKRLDNSQRSHTFVMAGCEWTVGMHQIQARRRG